MPKKDDGECILRAGRDAYLLVRKCNAIQLPSEDVREDNLGCDVVEGRLGPSEYSVDASFLEEDHSVKRLTDGQLFWSFVAFI